jgi:hypothetical protein
MPSHRIITNGAVVEKTNPLPVALVSTRPGAQSDVFADLVAHVGDWNEITALTAAVAALVSTEINGALGAVNIPAGVTIRGRVTSITLASGSVLAYRS